MTILELDNSLQSEWGIRLTPDQIKTIRMKKIIKHLENWRRQNPLESKSFENLAFQRDYNDTIIIVYGDITIYIGKYDFYYMKVCKGTIENYAQLSIDSLHGWVSHKPSDVTAPAYHFLQTCKLMNENLEIVKEVWQ